MVRKTITDPGLRPLVNGLVASFLTEGSVNAVHRRLADALARHGGKIYPNRLHALLSDDPGRAVNPQTIETVAVALHRLGPGLVEEAESRSAPLRARARRMGRDRRHGRARGHPTLGQRLAVPEPSR